MYVDFGQTNLGMPTFDFIHISKYEHNEKKGKFNGLFGLYFIIFGGILVLPKEIYIISKKLLVVGHIQKSSSL